LQRAEEHRRVKSLFKVDSPDYNEQKGKVYQTFLSTIKHKSPARDINDSKIY